MIMRFLAAAVIAASLVHSVASKAWPPTPTRPQRRSPDSPASLGFVTSQGGQLLLNNKPFHYFGANAYWLIQLSDTDVDNVMKNMTARNISVVRLWAFNDVFEIPAVGTWFQLFNPNGTVTINTGPTGLQRLDKVIATAKANGLMVQLALTNNWNPERPLTNATAGALGKRAVNVTHPPGFLSNDYGGMDAYVRANGLQEHDQFFSNASLIAAFKNYLNVVVSRYKTNTELLSWEIANDARCNSTLRNSDTCNTNTVTNWHSIIAQHIQSLDPNHLITAGTQGFQCTTCKKLFPISPPRPAVSPRAGQKRATGPLTTKQILSQQRASFKRSIDAVKKRWEGAAEKRARGDSFRWLYRGPEADKILAKRQSAAAGVQSISNSFSGAAGVDSEDISNIPEVGFSTFQLFPDQNIYSPPDPNLDTLNNTILTGVNWITQQLQSATNVGKPSILTGFGLVSQISAQAFTPFNSSQPFFTPNAFNSTPQIPTPTTAGVGVEQGQLPVTAEEQQVVYSQWIQAAISSGISGIIQYQWGNNLTVPTPVTQPQAPVPTVDQNTFQPAFEQQNVSPDDGYSAFSPQLQAIFQAASLEQLAKNV